MANENLVQKLAQIRGMADAVQKNSKGYNYKYADITSILAKVTAGMKKYGVSLIPMVVPETASVEQNQYFTKKTDKAGNQYDQSTIESLVTADMIFKWVNDDDPEDFIDVPWFMTGAQTDPSQAFGSGITYCTRYFLTSYFQIAQPESDVDSYRSKQKEAEESEAKYIAKEIIDKLDTELKQYLATNGDKAAEVKSLVMKYVKSGNYTTIKDPVLAGNLLQEFETKYYLV